jgi:hypothetical protein
MEKPFAVCLIDLGTKHERRTWHEIHLVIEVHRAHEQKSAKIPYLAHQLSVFIDRQPAMGLPETVFGGLRCELISMVYTEDNDLYWFGPS